MADGVGFGKIGFGRIGFGRPAPLRPGVREASPYVAPPSLHRGALRIAAAAPLLALILLFGAHVV